MNTLTSFTNSSDQVKIAPLKSSSKAEFQLPLLKTATPLVSVVIPVYNGAKYIQTALNSVVAQTYNNYEIIVIDDGSTDDTRQKLQPYKDKIRYIYQENQGSAAARNVGIDLAKGELIAFLDADDFWAMPEKLAKQVTCFKNNPSLGCINTGWKIVDDAGKHIKTVQPWHKAPQLDLETWLKKKCVRTSAMVFRKEWLEKVGGFDEELRQSHDVDLILRLSLAGCETIWLKEETVCYRQHEENTTKNSLKQAKYVQAVLDKFFARDDVPESISQQESQIRYHTLVWLAWYQYRAGNLDEMAKFLQKSLDFSPYLKVENISHWLSSFKRFSKERGDELDTDSLTSLWQWQQLIALTLFLKNTIGKHDLNKSQQQDLKEVVLLTNQENKIIINEEQIQVVDRNLKQANTLFSLPESIRKKPKLAVISWDLGHNPAGRSFLLADMAKFHYDVELIGAIFSFYGKELWFPLQNNVDLTIKSFLVTTFKDFLEEAKNLASQQKYDFVYISKPRFPSLFLGMLIKYYSKCPLILDIDDHELSFFRNQNNASFAELIEQKGDSKWYDLYSEIWTRFAEELIPYADAITVSNIALQKKYGGILVRHGRNEKIFDPKIYSRKNIRKQFGYTNNDKVILFLGTPRPHKGIFKIADALEKINDSRLVLCIIGTINDKRMSKKFESYHKARIDFHENQPWDKLPELILLADLICILQDANSPISNYQIPAKLTDALAMNIPTVVTKVPPLLDFIETKSVIAISEKDSLEEIIKKVLLLKEDFLSNYVSGRDTFLSELSYEVNSARIKQAIQVGAKKVKELPELFYEVTKLITQESGLDLIPDLESNKIYQKSEIISNSLTLTKERPLNILFFWKQNDSDIYGRRQDMIVKYLAKSDRINKIIHFDAPISSRKLQNFIKDEVNAKFSQNNLVFTNTVQRFLGLKDTSKILKRTFIYQEQDSDELFLGRSLPTKDEYPDFVKQVIKESGIDRNTIAWVCPVDFEFPALHQELNFSFVVADIIDDQRKWDVHPKYLARLEEGYQQILSKTNAVFTNCESVKNSFLKLNSNITIIPNGSEIFKDTKSWSKPEELENIKNPIIGYVGNLSDRIDIELLKYIATNNKTWNIVLIGSAHRNAQIFELAEFENIHLLGVKPYDEALSFIKHFDIAIIPHLNNRLTQNMNPLKLYVYFSAGVPIVSTKIANIEELSGSITVANNPQDFVNCIRQHLDNKNKNIAIDKSKRNLLLQKIDWQSRVENILDRLEIQLSKYSCSSNSNNFQSHLNYDFKRLEKTKKNRKKLFSDQELETNKLQASSSMPTKLPAEEQKYHGVCNLCGTKQTFYKKYRSLREGYECSNCKASLRYRGQASAILKVFGKSRYNYFPDLCNDQDFRSLSIYEPGVIGPFRKYFSNFNKYQNSYFWSEVSPGDYRDGLQCQNLENLTYENDLFDLVITSDIMEHLRHPWDAFNEIWRVLKPGGYHIFSIPVQMPMKQKTFYRVDTSSDKDVHLVEQRYHSAPNPKGGRQKSLVYVDFGQDIVEKLEYIGYQVDLLSPDYQENCDIHRLITFVTKKHQ